MKVSEICELVRSGEIVLDYAGHHVNATVERFLANHDRNLSMAAGANDGKWSNDRNEPVEEVNASMREHYQRKLDWNVEQEETFEMMGEREYCFGCGESIKWVLTGNKLQLREVIVKDKKAKFGAREHIYPVDYVCEFHEPQPTKGQIKVSSRLLFANFFRGIEDAPKDKKYSEEYSLNSLAGRKRITKYKAKHNVAYGQMGNMSIGIYVNQEKDSILVGPNCHPAEYEEHESEEEYETALKASLFNGYELAGGICLDVWRWEATDLNTIGKKNYSKLVKENEYRGIVELDVPYGLWEFEHMYDSKFYNHDDEKEDYVYAKLNFVNVI